MVDLLVSNQRYLWELQKIHLTMELETVFGVAVVVVITVERGDYLCLVGAVGAVGKVLVDLFVAVTLVLPPPLRLMLQEG
jgi:hypothetical protein